MEIEHLDYYGMVYDLQVDEDESFIAEGIVVHNCAMIPIVIGRPVPQIESGQDWFRRQPPGVQQQMMGPGRYKLWAEGDADLRQMVTVKPNETWGPSTQVKSVRDLERGR